MTATLELLGRIGLFGARVVWATVTLQVPLQTFLDQLRTVILRCMLPVIAVVFPFGMVMSLQGLEIFALFAIFTPEVWRR